MEDQLPPVATGYVKLITKNFGRLVRKLHDVEDKWGQSVLIHIKNTKKHMKLCTEKNSLIYDPTAVKRAYMNEIWLSETPPPTGVDTQELLNHIIDGNEDKFKSTMQDMAPLMPEETIKLWYVQMTNLYKAVDILFGTPYNQAELSEKLILDVHLMVLNNVLADGNAGEYRTVEVRAAGSSVEYELPKDIRPRLLALVEFTNTQYKLFSADIENSKSLGNIFCLGAFFLSEFLLIHPFRDGNGRTSRLLLSHLLRHHTIVPVSLYLRSNRDLYINAMQSRTSGTALPTGVVQYVVECVDEIVMVSYRTQVDLLDKLGLMNEIDDLPEIVANPRAPFWLRLFSFCV